MKLPKFSLLICGAASLFTFANADARPLGKVSPDGAFKVIPAGTLPEDGIIDGVTFALVGKDGKRKTYRIYHIQAPIDPTPTKAANANLREFLTRQKFAIYSSGATETLTVGEGEKQTEVAAELVFINTARGLLGARIVSDGLAYAGGDSTSDLPDGTAAAAYLEELRKLSQRAETSKLGVFGKHAEPEKDIRVNINTATSDELQELPGIGPATAATIIKERPIRSISKFTKIDGIGPATEAKLRRLIKFKD